MTRRNFLWMLSGAPLAAVMSQSAAAAAPTKSLQQLRDDWKTLLSPSAEVARSTEALKLSNDEWRKRLSADQFYVLREEGTERAGTSALNAEKRPGVFVCAGCALPLFTSEMKFESGTGWPSFFTHIPGRFATKRDFKLIVPRTEYHCVRCEGHHGHVFNDGPQPTGERWCNNGVALRFIPA